MHGDTDPIGKADLARWAYLVWSVARAMLLRSKKIKSVEQLVGWV
jgi:hypothetical protein